MITAKKLRTSFQVEYPHDPALDAFIKAVPGYEWHKATGSWRFPLDVDAFDALQSLPIKVGQSLADWACVARANRDMVDIARKAEEAELLYERASDLFRFQRVGVDVMATAGRLLLHDQMGLGKTVEAIAAVRELELAGSGGDGLYLIVCGNSVRHNWAAEIQRWYDPEATIQHVRSGRELINPVPAWYIVNWELTHRREALQGVPWDVVIADECHRMKGRNTKQSKAVRSLKSRHAFLLSGTPIKNDVMDLWPQLNFLYPERFSSYWKFFERFVDYRENFFGREIIGVKNEKELRAATRTAMFGRSLDEVEIQLPRVTHQTISVDLKGDQKKAYERMRDEFIAWLEGQEEQITAANWLTQVLRLKQIAGSLGIFYEESPESAKLDALDGLIEELPDTEKFVVMTQFRGMVDQLTARLRAREVSYCELTGGSCTAWIPSVGYRHGTNRQELIDWFNTSERPKVFVATTQTGGEGITLTAARYFVFLDLLWTPGDNDQAWKRIHRIGQERACFVYRILARDTVDFSAVLPKLRSKQAIIDAVLAPQEEPDGGA